MAGAAAANAAMLGMQIGGEVANIYQQYVNYKLARRALRRQLNQVQERTFLNAEATAAQSVLVTEEKKRQQFEVQRSKIAAQGEARVKAAQFGANAEPAVDTVGREAESMLDKISLSADNMLADIIQQSKEATASIVDQIWGLNTQLPQKWDLSGAAMRLGTAYLEYQNREFQRTGKED